VSTNNNKEDKNTWWELGLSYDTMLKIYPRLRESANRWRFRGCKKCGKTFSKSNVASFKCEGLVGFSAAVCECGERGSMLAMYASDEENKKAKEKFRTLYEALSNDI